MIEPPHVTEDLPDRQVACHHATPLALAGMNMMRTVHAVLPEGSN
jgi:hypothetical protein